MGDNSVEQVKELTNDKTELLVKLAKKQLLWQKISTFSFICALLALLYVITGLVPKVETTLDHYNEVAIKAQESLAQVDSMSKELEEASTNINKLVEDNFDELTSAVNDMSNIDFEGLNKAIQDLEDTVGPFANFMRSFR
ncbi:MAG: hypothetical protein II842_20400 [Butyrivibrio sp.]|nr:hypothetical protein [Butyrivibrio sp.]